MQDSADPGAFLFDCGECSFVIFCLFVCVHVSSDPL